MALPGDVTTITVTGTYLDMEGNPQHGTVTFAPSTGPFADATSPAFFEPVPVVATTYFGQISVVLPCTSNADFAPDTWAWQVTEQIEGSGERTYYVELPSTLGSTVDLSDLAQVEPTSSFTGYLPLAAGSASPVGGTVYLDGSPPLKLPSGTSGDVLMSDGSGNLTLQPVGDADWYNVKDPAYGALGNGSDATAAINAAITACHTAGGGTVYIPEGLYTISAPLLIGGGNPGALVIRGSGWNSELKLASGANCYIFDTGSSGSPQYTNGLVIADLYLDCNGANQTADSGAIYGRGSVWGVFEHLWIDQPYNYGVRFYQDGLGHYGHHNRLFGCKFTNGNGGGVYTPPSGALGIALYFDNADENSCHGCTFQDNGTSTYPATQVYDTGSGRQSFSGCTWVTTQTTSASMFKTNSSPSGCQITGCQFDSATTGNLLEINGPDCVIVGNEFLSFGQGSGSNAAIHLSSTYTQVTSNGFTPAGSNGIAVQETGTALTGVGYNVISGCSLSGSYYESAPVVLVSGDDSSYVTYPLPLSIGGTGASSASAARTNLGLGSAATQSSSAFDAAGAAAAAQSAAEAASLPLSGGQLTGGLTVTSLQVTGGTIASGDVLTSDSSGNATWQAATGGGGSSANTLTVFNVKSSPYSATGNGTTDDTSAIASALSAASGGGIVYFPPGTYLVSSPLVMTSYITIQGAGSQASVIKGASGFPSSSQCGVLTFGNSTSTTSGPSIASCSIADIGFDMTAVNDATRNQVNAVFQDYSVLTNLRIERIWYSGQENGCCIMFNGLGRGESSAQWCYGITIRDVYALNGAGTVCCYSNSNQSGSVISGLNISSIYNHISRTIEDDRVAISGNSAAAGDTLMRDITIRDIFVDVASGSGGVVNGVKLDTGTYGQIQNVLISGVHYYALSSGGAVGNPVIMYSAGTGAAIGFLQDYVVENVFAQNSYGIQLFLNRFATAPQVVVRNVVMENCRDAEYLVSLLTQSTAVGDESVIFDGISGNSVTTPTAYVPMGIQLWSGSSAKGASGVVAAKGLMFTGVTYGITSTVNGGGTGTATTAYSNQHVGDSNLSAASTPVSLTNSYTISNVTGASNYPAGSTPPAPTLITATNASWPIPAGAGWLKIIAVGGGGGGGGGGSSQVTSPVAQAGGGGGSSGVFSEQVVAVGSNTTLNVTIGSGGSGGSAGTAGSGGTGNAGGGGGTGTATTVTGTGISVYGAGGSQGANSGASTTTAAAGGAWGAAATQTTEYGAGYGGESGKASAYPFSYSPSGGGGGGAASATASAGGGGGAAGSTSGAAAAGTTAGSGTGAGVAGSAAAANSSGGGGGGGGGSGFGGGNAGGAGGAGGSGFAIIQVIG